MRAAKIDANQPEIVKALLAVGCSVQSLAKVGDGCPDLLVWSPAVGLMLLEVKDGAKPPSARRLTPAQRQWHAEWGGYVCVVVSVEQALCVVRGIGLEMALSAGVGVMT